jgi:hypothetical protein
LALPKDILRKVKIIAVQEGTSVSGLLTRILNELVSREEGYRTAHLHHLTILEKGLDMGSEGIARWTREELHER